MTAGPRPPASACPRVRSRSIICTRSTIWPMPICRWATTRRPRRYWPPLRVWNRRSRSIRLLRTHSPPSPCASHWSATTGLPQRRFRVVGRQRSPGTSIRISTQSPILPARWAQFGPGSQSKRKWQSRSSPSSSRRPLRSTSLTTGVFRLPSSGWRPNRGSPTSPGTSRGVSNSPAGRRRWKRRQRRIR